MVVNIEKNRMRKNRFIIEKFDLNYNQSCRFE